MKRITQEEIEEILAKITDEDRKIIKILEERNNLVVLKTKTEEQKERIKLCEKFSKKDETGAPISIKDGDKHLMFLIIL
jgi:DNA repair photolyase